MSRLSPQIRKEIYTAAVQGHGFAHWERIVADLGALRRPQKLLIAFITDDFYRPLSQVGESQIACLNGKIACTSHYWYPISDDMKAIATKRWNDRQNAFRLLLQDPKAGLKALLPASFGVVRIMAGYDKVSDAAFANSVRILSDFANSYDTRLIWIPDRSELEQTNPRQEAVAKVLAEKGLSAMRCKLPADGFLPRDGHPKAKGYDALRDCVESVIRNWTTIPALSSASSPIQSPGSGH